MDPEEIMKSIWNDMSHSLASHSDWQVELVGQDGSIRMDALPLVLFSPVMRDVLQEQKNVPYIVKVILPDFRMESLRHIATFIKHGFVNAEERHLLQLTDIITVLKLSVEIGQFTVTDIMKDQVVSTYNEACMQSQSSGSGESNVMMGEELRLPFRKEGSKQTLRIGIGRPSTSGKSKGKKIIKKASFVDPAGEMCIVCSKVFRSKEILAIHFKTHEKNETKVKPPEKESLVCKVCGLESHTIMGKLNHSCDIKKDMKRFTCASCERTYAEKCIMLCHQQQHAGQKRLNCPICSMKLQTLWLLVHHVRRHTNESDKDFGKFINEDSNSSMADDSSSRQGDFEHMNVSPGDVEREALICQVCSQIFSSGIEKVEHLCSYSPEQVTFQCKLCDKLFLDECFMLVHQQQHSSDMKMTCSICANSFPSILDLITHVRKHLNGVNRLKTVLADQHNGLVHSGSTGSLFEDRILTQLFQCVECDLSFGTKARLLLHEQTHKGKSESECPYCGREYTSISNAVLHVKIHINLTPEENINRRKSLKESRKSSKDSETGSLKDVGEKESDAVKTEVMDDNELSRSSETQFSLGVAANQSSFSNPTPEKSVLNVETSLVCNECNRTFDWKGTLLLHQQVHKGKSDLECPECGKSFQMKNHANLHMRTHYGYSCKFCKEIFPVKKEMMVHRREVHSSELKESKAEVPKKIKKRKTNIMTPHFEGEDVLSPKITKLSPPQSILDNIEASASTSPVESEPDFGSSSFTVTGDIRAEEPTFPAASLMDDSSAECSLSDDGTKYLYSESDCDQSQIGTPTQEQPEVACPFCDKVYRSINTMSAHIQSHSGITCKHCNQQFHNNADHVKHQKESCVKVTCHICNKLFIGYNAYTKHKQEEHVSKPGRTKHFWCEICNEQFLENEQLIEHQNHCSLPFPEEGPPLRKEKYYYRCSTCAEILDSRATLFYHEQAHENTTALECPKCKKQNITKQGAIMHISCHWLETCDQCMIKFSCLGHLIDHKKVCAGGNNFKLDLPSPDSQ